VFKSRYQKYREKRLRDQVIERASITSTALVSVNAVLDEVEVQGWPCDIQYINGILHQALNEQPETLGVRKLLERVQILTGEK
jgi:hypothetical protein